MTKLAAPVSDLKRPHFHSVHRIIISSVLAVFAVLWTPVFAASAETLIYAGHLIDSIHNRALSARTVIVRDGHIVSIAKGYLKPKPDQRVIDLKQQTVLPGLMDMHVHLSSQFSPQAYTEGFFMNDADVALRATVYARRTLMAGFTTVRDLGAQHGVIISLRNAIAKGWVVGPRIFAAGKAIGSTGGHADPTNHLNRRLMGDPGPAEGIINGADEARKAVRQRYKEGSDVIKVMATGGVLSLERSGQNPQLTAAELKAIVDTARDYNLTVAVHAHGAEGIKRAIRAGVTSIEHGTYMDSRAITLMKQHGTWYVPTILAGKFVAEKAKIEGYFPELVRPKARAIGPLIQATFARAYKAGVKIAFGTDTGVSPHGQNAKEFVYMVAAGMKPMEAIRSATINAATLIRRNADLGTLEPGKLADIIAVKGNPLNDIALLQQVDFVMKGGHVYRQP